MRRGTNLRALGGFNQTVVLDAVRRGQGEVSRVEIARHTGLSAQTVSNVCRRLLDSGVIREAGQASGGVGKPRMLLELEPSGGFAIGVHIDPAVITYVILDLAGTVLAHSSVGVTRRMSPDAITVELTENIDALVGASGIDASRILGIGVAAPGPIDPDRGMVLEPPLLEGWHSVAIRSALAEATALPVLLEKDVSAAAIAELWTSDRDDRDDFVFFYYGSGVGVGITLDRGVVRGPGGNAGDIGHTLVDPNGPECPCGRRGCLGVSVEPRTVAALDPVGGPDADDVDAVFLRVVRDAERGDADARAIVTGVLDRIALATVGVLNLLDLRLVVMGGPSWMPLADGFLPYLSSAINDAPTRIGTGPVEVVTCRAGADVAAIGAASLVLDNTLSPRPSALLISA